MYFTKETLIGDFVHRYKDDGTYTVLSEEQERNLLDRILNEEDYERGDVSVCVWVAVVCVCWGAVGGVCVSVV